LCPAYHQEINGKTKQVFEATVENWMTSGIFQIWIVARSSNVQGSDLIASQRKMKGKLDRTSIERAGYLNGANSFIADFGAIEDVECNIVLFIDLI
jgi:hypothetical protein